MDDHLYAGVALQALEMALACREPHPSLRPRNPMLVRLRHFWLMLNQRAACLAICPRQVYAHVC